MLVRPAPQIRQPGTVHFWSNLSNLPFSATANLEVWCEPLAVVVAMSSVLEAMKGPIGVAFLTMVSVLVVSGEDTLLSIARPLSLSGPIRNNADETDRHANHKPLQCRQQQGLRS